MRKQKYINSGAESPRKTLSYERIQVEKQRFDRNK